MASTNHTDNYALPQWERTDPFQMEDFNDAFEKIDTAIALAGAKISIGSYEGDGLCGPNHPHTLHLDFQPKLLIIIADIGLASSSLFFIDGVPTATGLFYGSSSLQSAPVTVIRSGNDISWYYGDPAHPNSYYYSQEIHASMECNSSGRTYHYIAIA